MCKALQETILSNEIKGLIKDSVGVYVACLELSALLNAAFYKLVCFGLNINWHGPHSTRVPGTFKSRAAFPSKAAEL